MDIKTKVLPANEVAAAGFAKFNSGHHLCVEVPDDWFTISCKTSNGKLVTFAFCPDGMGGTGHQCVDVHHATAEKKTIERNGESYEIACQNVHVFGQGWYKNPLWSMDYYKNNVDKPMTLTTILLTPLEGAD